MRLEAGWQDCSMLSICNSHHPETIHLYQLGRSNVWGHDARMRILNFRWLPWYLWLKFKAEVTWSCFRSFSCHAVSISLVSSYISLLSSFHCILSYWWSHNKLLVFRNSCSLIIYVPDTCDACVLFIFVWFYKVKTSLTFLQIKNLSLSLNNFIIFVLPVISISVGNTNCTGATSIDLQNLIRSDKHISNIVGNAIHTKVH